MQRDFFEHATTHMQQVANCIAQMAEVSKTLDELAKKNPTLAPTLLRVLHIFETTGEGVILLQDDLVEMARIVAPFLLSIPLDSPSDTDADTGNNLPSQLPPTPPENQY